MKNKTFKIFFNLCWLSLLFILTVNVFSGFIVVSPHKSRYSSSYGDVAAPYSTVTSETINFTHREETYIETAYGVPLYTQINTYPNSCGPVGGAIIVGFYDKYYENLIPDYNPCLSSGKYRKNDDTIRNVLMKDLYTLMRTNVDDVGVSEPDCKNGLSTYVKNHGYNLTYSSVKSGSTVSESAYASSINNNRPVLLFCSKMDLYQFSTTATQDNWSTIHYNGAHVAVGFGLYTVKYYNGNTNFRTDKYLRIATGLSEFQDGFIKISSNDWCDNAYSVTVA